jgi:hypothetical protein
MGQGRGRDRGSNPLADAPHAITVDLFLIAIHHQAEAPYPYPRGLSSTSRTASVKDSWVKGFSRRLTPSSTRPAWTKVSRA